MKGFTLFVFFLAFSAAAFAQFPLGANKDNISQFFDQNVQYASFQDFRTKEGNEAVCYTKTSVLGDYTFYFDHEGACCTYTETYDKRQLNDIIWRMDRRFCRVADREWRDEDNTFRVTLNLRPRKGANFVSITYTLTEPHPVINSGTLAIN
ncbi:MAG: hypothetical protein JSU01_11600 [Bacteroidetes bacterium]|nr:hypothetical protein [Bacteroidota bacterium]